eukprot:TRINITY_DN5245_c0_g1_i2.p1 TRINITY_DN5245_c0_g1~~TRINITY_DN5245_c0_g1_i2.p1  ORF type:complete len:341 (-),score=68.36 TRINITY_DN5245_c0_g1_i2:18-1040(-)
MIRRPPRSTQSRSSAASDVYKRQVCDQLETLTIHAMSDSTRELEFIAPLPCLRELALHACGQLSSLILHPQALPVLNSLTLSKCHRLDDKALCLLIGRAPVLTHLKVSECDWISNIDPPANLITLTVESCRALTHLECSSAQLESLHVDWCTRLRVVHIQASSLSNCQIDARGAELKHLVLVIPAVQQLCLSNISKCADIGEILTESLVTLELHGCAFDSSQVGRFVHRSMHCLTSLQISTCQLLTELCLTQPTSLHTLSVSGCKRLKKLQTLGGRLPDIHIQLCGGLSSIHAESDHSAPNEHRNLMIEFCPKVRQIRLSQMYRLESSPRIHKTCVVELV